MFSSCASTSKACKITTTQATKEFLLNNTRTTYMNPDWFIWGDAENGGSGFGDMSKEEW
jgi:cobalamin biosynthesis Mg chelatase CobN